jgi:hypothetical protein
VPLTMRSAVAALCLACLGCAYLATKTNTPAARQTADDLEAAPLPSGESYYIIVFGSQSIPKVPSRTHTWATVIRATDSMPNDSPKIENHTISWMPATLQIRPWSLEVEKGVNLELIETVELMQKEKERISMWGPYEVRPGFYRKFMIQKKFLDEGNVGYQCIDSTGEAARSGRGCDCIHAITDMDAIYDRTRYRLDRYGEAASQFIVKQFFERRVLISPDTTHDWIISKLGLDKFEIVHRVYDGPAEPYEPPHRRR